jgi:predicted Rossmann fold flavoprotein
MSARRVIVVGAGAAGLMAAGQAAQAGAETLLLEKMDRPAKKLGISGNRRCNLTNIAPPAELVSHFGSGGRFLRPALALFGPRDLMAFFGDLGVRTVIRENGRVFPSSGRAEDVVDALAGWVAGRGVTLERRAAVEALVVREGAVTAVRIGARRVEKADAVVVATGGASYPATGSTGQGYKLAAALGHTIVPIRPALVPLETGGDTAGRLQGLALGGVSVRVIVDGKVRGRASGEMLFTHFGVSGPAVLSLSRQIVDALEAGHRVALSIDLKPEVDDRALDRMLAAELGARGRQLAAGWLKRLLPRTLAPISAEAANIRPDKPASQVTAEERKRLRLWLKDFRLEVARHRGFNEAMVTAGGVSTREVDPRTMASRLAKGLYFAGEVLDLDADTGGFNLQAAFSTGWVAGRAAAG